MAGHRAEYTLQSPLMFAADHGTQWKSQKGNIFHKRVILTDITRVRFFHLPPNPNRISQSTVFFDSMFWVRLSKNTLH